MTLERYMGLAYPLFHKTTITKRRMIIFLAGIHICFFIIDTFTTVFKIPAFGSNSFVVLFLTLSVVLAILMNYKIVLIAKSRSQNTHLGNNRKNIQSKRYYACVLAVASFSLCCCPASVFYGFSLNCEFTYQFITSCYLSFPLVSNNNYELNHQLFDIFLDE